MNTAILIPARLASTRFPEKPLKLLNGVPMIRRVYDRCLETGLDTFVLTDSKRIASLFPKGNIVVHDDPYENGTERCAGVLRDSRFDQYKQFINVQGDEPMIDPNDIRRVILEKKKSYKSSPTR